MQRPSTGPLPHSSPTTKTLQHPTQAWQASSPSLWPQENKVLDEILLLQEAAQKYKLEPHEQFGAWFRDTERLSENER